jgi:hypothetical protein
MSEDGQSPAFERQLTQAPPHPQSHQPAGEEQGGGGLGNQELRRLEDGVGDPDLIDEAIEEPVGGQRAVPRSTEVDVSGVGGQRTPPTPFPMRKESAPVEVDP